MAPPETFCAAFHDAEKTAKVNYTQFGDTGLTVSKIAFGCSGLGAVKDVASEKSAIEAVLEALRSGVNYLDTAPWYGHGKGETVLGKALEGVPRSAYHIATKVGRYEAAYDRMFDFSASRTQRSAQESLQRLGIKSFDILQVHDVEFAPSVDYIIQETLPVLESLRQAGITKCIGITGYPLSTLREIVEKSPVKIDMVLSYCRGTLFDDTLRAYISHFQERGMGIANAAVLGMGLLAQGPLPSWHPAPEEVRNACNNAQQYCQSLGVSLEKLGLWYSMNQFPGVHTTVVGMTTTKMVEQNLNSDTISTEEQLILNHIMERYFAPLKVRHWEGRELAKIRAKLSRR